jgi:prefoldin beta subunit
MTDDKKVHEMQLLDQGIHNIMMQKQAFQIELSETTAALKEIEASKDEVFKIIGNLMIKTDKNSVKEELTSKERLLDLRLKTLEKQESSLTEQLERIRGEFLKKGKK